MLFQTRIKIDWEIIKNRKRRNAAYNNKRENRSRITHTYKVGDKVLLIIKRNEVQAKLKQPTRGPYDITKIFTNRTIKIRRGTYKEIINICCIKRYYTRE